MKQNQDPEWRNWGDHPLIVIIGLLASLITVVIFLTGRTTLYDLLSKNTSPPTETPITVPYDSLVQGVKPDVSSRAYQLAVSSGKQAAVEELLGQITTIVTYNTFQGEPDQIVFENNKITRRIVNEEEHIEVNPNNCEVWWFWGGESTGWRFSARQDWQLVQKPGQYQEGYGIMIRADGKSHYQFSIRDNEQQFSIEYWSSGNADKLQDWLYSDAIRPGQVNRLGVVAEGGHYYVIINGIVVSELHDERILVLQRGFAFRRISTPSRCHPERRRSRSEGSRRGIRNRDSSLCSE